MDCVQAVDLAAWGSEACWLKLPGFTVCLNGVSATQKEKILFDYSPFVVSRQGSSNANHVLFCEAYQLDTELDESVSELEKEGQYAPRIKRTTDVIEITGFNFLATFSVGHSNVHSARIGVAYENEFALPLVLENFLRIYSAYNAINLSGAILHSAGLVFDDSAYVFVGYSGVGKTTLTRKAHLNGATVLSDDLNLILPSVDGAGFDAFKVPFTGEFGRTVDHANTDSSFPVKAIVLLEQDKQIAVKSVNPSVAISRLLAGSPFVNTDEAGVVELFKIYNALVNEVPVLKLGLPLDAVIGDILDSINQLIESI